MDNMYDEYKLTTREVVNILNIEYADVFAKKVDTRKINYWIQNYEINAIKSENNRWLFSELDVLDFVYRYKYNYLHNWKNHFDNTSIKVSTDVLYEIFKECEDVFQKIVCILTTLHPYALFNDPTRRYYDLGRHEGGIIFKEAAIKFDTNRVSFKGSISGLNKQRLFYPIIVTNVIENIIIEYNQTHGDDVTKRLINVGLKLVNNKITLQEYTDELDRHIYFGGWRGLIRNYESIAGNEMNYLGNKY